MEKEELVRDIAKQLTVPIGLVQAFFLLCFFGSPVVWIWVGFDAFWKVCLTSLFGVLVMYFVYTMVKKAATEVVDEEIKKQLDKKSEPSKFREKLDKAMKG